MLQHAPDPSQSLPDAAHTRVKVEVLARAIAAIEERHAEQARQLEGTALVGDVVQDLQLDVTPEELLAEVEAQQKAALFSWNSPALGENHAGAQLHNRTERDRKAFWSMIRISMATVATLIFVFWCLSFRSPFAPPLYQSSSAPFMSTYPPRLSPSAPTHSLFFHGTPVGMLPAQMEYQRGGPVHALADIVDGHPFGCSTYTLQSLLRHDPLNTIMLYDAERDMTYDQRKSDVGRGFSPFSPGFVGPMAWSAWTLIKHNGQIYLRGWVQQSEAQQNSSEKIVSIFNVQSPMKDLNRFVPITLLLSNLDMEGLYQNGRNSPYDISVSNPSQQLVKELLVHGLHLDSHTWEKWQP